MWFGASIGAGVEVSTWLQADGSIQYTKSVNQNWTAQWNIEDPSGAFISAIGGRPVVGQPFWIQDNGVTRFSGLVSQVIEQSLRGPSGAILYSFQGSGWTTVCDHRVVTAEYNAGQTSLSAITDIYNQTIASDGIAFTDVPPPTRPTLNVVLGVVGTSIASILAIARPIACIGFAMPNAP